MVQSATKTTAENSFFLAELDRLGPMNPPQAWDLAQANNYSKLWARRQYENFTVVSFLLPRRIRQDFYNVYAYCRWSDNLADEVESSSKSLDLLHWWSQQLSLCYSGRPAHPVLFALQSTIRKHNIPKQPFEDLLSAFKQDQTVFRYEDDSSLLDYCKRSANPVGRILLHMAKQDQNVLNDENLRMSDAICTGLQLANFCQDMCRDAKIGRIYLPQSRWKKLTEQEILSSKVTEGLQTALQDWVETTRTFFHEGYELVRRVPRWLALDVDLFVRGGLATLNEITKSNYDVWTQRPTVSKLKKICLLVQAMLGPLRLPQNKLVLPASTGDLDS